MAAEEKAIYSCIYCEKSFTSSSNLYRHTRRSHQKNSRGENVSLSKFTCAHCDKEYSNKSSLKHHVESVHSSIVVKYKCDKCAYESIHKGTMNRHFLRKHSSCKLNNCEEKPRIKCDKCSSSFSSIGNLRRHKMKVHKTFRQTNIKRKCPLCLFYSTQSSKKEIIDHFRECHKLVIKSKKYIFCDFIKFIEWKKQLRIDSSVSFIKAPYGHARSLHFVCHRRGYFRTRGRNIRQMRKSGSCKINGYCPSEIHAKITKNGTVSVIYFPTHVGHDSTELIEDVEVDDDNTQRIGLSEISNSSQSDEMHKEDLEILWKQLMEVTSSNEEISFVEKILKEAIAVLNVARGIAIRPLMEDSKPWENQTRLPLEVVPELYDIFLNPDLNNGKFSGSIKINLEVLSERKIIVLHANELTVSSTKLIKLENAAASHDSGVDIAIADTFNYPRNQYFVIVCANLIQPGSYVLALNFSGSLTGKIVGFYKSTYKDAMDGSRKAIATTKFEPTYARSAFPCFDEPSFKAEFVVSLVKPSNSKFIALSNMNVVKKEVDQPVPGSTVVRFAKSVPMSTYLACFIVCDFEQLESVKSKQGFPVTVYGRRGQIDNLKYAHDLAVKTVNYYIQYFEINYPLPKLDLIAIPDFVSGAMENWGLITFRETSVFFNPEVSSPLNKKVVAIAVTHELAHMWFGNLATMKWWDDLWLNEGFASYIEYKGVNHSHPDWDMDTQFLSDTLHPVFQMDSVVSSHPIVNHVAHPDQITEIFDMISYNKGASVIRMLEDIVGADNFRRGVSDYLRQFSFKNAVTQDLWNSISQYTSDMDISKVMDTYTRQMGLPVVTISQEGNTLTLTQRRFLANKNSTFDECETDFKYKWEIPLTYVTSNNPSKVHRTWLHLDDNSTSIRVPAGTKWVKFNLKQKGYYRVNYSPEGWKALSDLLLDNHEMLSAADRASLLDDAFSLASAGYLNYKIALNLLKYIPKESHFVPLQVTARVLIKLDEHLRDTAVYDKFKKFVQNLLQPLVVDSMWNSSPSEAYKARRKRIILFSLLTKFEIPSAVCFAHKKFTDWLLNNGPKPDVDVRGIIYETGIKNSSKEEWDKLWKIYLKEDEPQESSRIRNTLVASNDPAVIERLIELGKDEHNVRSQDYILMLASISHNPVGNKVVWKFVREHWSYLVNRFTLNDRLLGRLIPAISANFGSEDKLQELKDFFAANPESGAGTAGRKIALEQTQNNINWLKTHVSELAEAL